TWSRARSPDSNGAPSCGESPAGKERLAVPRGISPRVLPCPPRARTWITTTSECFCPEKSEIAGSQTSAPSSLLPLSQTAKTGRVVLDEFSSLIPENDLSYRQRAV